MSQKTQHTPFDDNILRKLANEDKLQVVTPCSILRPSSLHPKFKITEKVTNSCSAAKFDLEKQLSNPLSLPDGLAGCD